MVDPDNRRAVDFTTRRAALETLPADPDWAALCASWPDGRIKLALTRRLLALRDEHRALFERGDYVAVKVEGEHKDHVLAFARRHGEEAVVVSVGRHFAPLTDGGREWPIARRWRASLIIDELGPLEDCLVPERRFRGREIAISDLFATMPVALLRRRA